MSFYSLQQTIWVGIFILYGVEKFFLDIPISAHLVSRDIDNFRLSFHKCLYREMLWKIEIVSCFRLECEGFY